MLALFLPTLQADSENSPQQGDAEPTCLKQKWTDHVSFAEKSLPPAKVASKSTLHLNHSRP